MAMWQWGLLALGVLWALQSLGVWYQMRHYGDVMKGIKERVIRFPGNITRT